MPITSGFTPDAMCSTGGAGNGARSQIPKQKYLGMIFYGDRALIRPGSISHYYKKLHKAKKLAIKSRDKHHCEILFKRKLYRK
ncbi:hypothetical protein BHC54_06585 [Snodgrassella alvi]|uniref:Uncharacterized protein n=1 Tax=Snodgrassella alvi TaxID=1196083 RepID=A0A2N9X4W4_9NEIS|nr:hypothetical protein BHC54_06585 [Snodgrassella alvi]